MTDTADLRRILADILSDAAQRREVAIVEGVEAPEPGAFGVGMPAYIGISLARLEELATCAGLAGGLHEAIASVWERGRASLH